MEPDINSQPSIIPQDPSSFSQENPKKKWIMLGIGGFLIVLIVVLASAVFLMQRNNTTKQIADTNSPSVQPTAPAQNVEPQQPQGQALPTVNVATWSAQVTPPAPPASLTVYKTKQNYTLTEIKAIAGKLNADEDFQEAENSIISYSIADEAVFMMDKLSGEFSYRSTTGVLLPTGVNENESVYAFLKSLNMYDDTIKVTASYTKKSEPGVKFVELHRDWKSVGMPILSTIGIVNIPEDTKFASLSLTSAASNTPEDLDIAGTTDRTDALKRRNDFNTITVGISQTDKKIISVSSNMRILTAQPTTAAPIAASDVLPLLEANKQNFIFTSPAGEGVPDMSKIYAGNKVSTKQAVITDITIAYIEQPPTVAQTQLDPHYVIRGYMESDNGYRLNYVATLEAVKKPLSFNFKLPTFNFKFIKEANAQITDPGQKQGTVTFPTSQPVNSKCVPTEADMIPPVLEYAGMRIGYALRHDGPGYEWYYLNRKNLSKDQILQNIVVLLKALPTLDDRGDDSSKREKMQKLIKDILSSPDCPVRFTGSSPTVFVYGTEGSKLSVTLPQNTTYTEPVTKENAWNVEVTQNGIEANGLERDYLYYEYAQISFEKPENGWIIDRSELSTFSKNLADKMKLTAKEESRLLFELNHALADVSGKSLFIGLTNKEELDAKLPISIQGEIDTIKRYHFYVGPATKQMNVISPIISPVERTNAMVLEIGASSGK